MCTLILTLWKLKLFLMEKFGKLEFLNVAFESFSSQNEALITHLVVERNSTVSDIVDAFVNGPSFQKLVGALSETVSSQYEVILEKFLEHPKMSGPVLNHEYDIIVKNATFMLHQNFNATRSELLDRMMGQEQAIRMLASATTLLVLCWLYFFARSHLIRGPGCCCPKKRRVTRPAFQDQSFRFAPLH